MITKTDIQNTAEYQWRGRHWKGYLIFLGIIAVASLMIILPDAENIGQGLLTAGLIIGLYLCVFAPLVLNEVVRQRDMIKSAENYVRSQGVLSNPAESKFYKKSIYYQITFQLMDGTQLTRNTQPVFCLATWENFNARDYDGRQAEIFYDKEKDRVIVIDMVEEESEDYEW